MVFLSHLINGIQSGKYLCNYRTGLHHGLRYRKDAEFRPRRRNHDRRLCLLLHYKLPESAAVCRHTSAVVICTLLGVVIERFAYKPLRQAPALAVLITAIGVSYFLQNLALLIWKSDPKVFTSVVTLPSLKLFDGELVISSVSIVTVLTCIVIMVVLTLFTEKGKMGKSDESGIRR